MRPDLLRRQERILRDDAANPQGARFDLGTWGKPSDEAPDDFKRSSADRDYLRWSNQFNNSGYDEIDLLKVVPVPVSCNTMACAFGLAAITGEFAAEGLSYTIHSGYLEPVMRISDKSGDYTVSGFSAAEHLFGIDADDAKYLFDPESYAETPVGAQGEIEVADRIARFILGEIDYDHYPEQESDDE